MIPLRQPRLTMHQKLPIKSKSHCFSLNNCDMHSLFLFLQWCGEAARRRDSAKRSEETWGGRQRRQPNYWCKSKENVRSQVHVLGYEHAFLFSSYHRMLDRSTLELWPAVCAGCCTPPPTLRTNRNICSSTTNSLVLSNTWWEEGDMSSIGPSRITVRHVLSQGCPTLPHMRAYTHRHMHQKNELDTSQDLSL